VPCSERLARRYAGALIGFVMREPHHCADELTAQDIITRLKRK